MKRIQKLVLVFGALLMIPLRINPAPAAPPKTAAPLMPKPRPVVPAQTLKLPHKAPAPAVLQRLRAPLSRSAIVGALLADPATRQELTRIGARYGIPASAITKLATTQLGALAAGPQAPAAPPPEPSPVESMDWKNGITFPVTDQPTYAYDGKDWAFCGYAFNSVVLTGSMREFMATGVVGLELNAQKTSYALYLELPAAPATYLVTFRFGDAYYGLPPDWFSRGLTPFSASWSNFNRPESKIPLARLSDGSGLVGVVTIEPRAMGNSGYPEAHMRVVNASLGLQFDGNVLREIEDANRLDRNYSGPMETTSVIYLVATATTIQKL